MFMFGSLRRRSKVNSRDSPNSETDVVVKNHSIQSVQNNNSESLLNNRGLITGDNKTKGSASEPIKSSYDPTEKVWFRHEELEAMRKAELEEINYVKETPPRDNDQVKPLLSATGGKNPQPPFSTSQDILHFSDIHKKKIIIAEWQRIAAVVDRVLFIFFFLTTLTAYLIILLILPAQHYTTQKDSLSEAILENSPVSV